MSIISRTPAQLEVRLFSIALVYDHKTILPLIAKAAA